MYKANKDFLDTQCLIHNLDWISCFLIWTSPPKYHKGVSWLWALNKSFQLVNYTRLANTELARTPDINCFQPENRQNK